MYYRVKDSNTKNWIEIDEKESTIYEPTTMAESTKNFSSLRVQPFYGKKKEWVSFEEKFLTRAKHKGYKDLLMGRQIDKNVIDVK
jgi:hypothetical protein